MRPGPTRLLQVLCWSWVVLCAAYFSWEYATFSGLYRRLADLQVAYFGKYAIHLTAIVPFLVVAGPAMSLLGARGRHWRLVGGQPPPDVHAPKRARRTAWALIGLGLACCVVAAFTYGVGRSQEVPPGPPVQMDLATAGSGAPPEGRVTLLGSVLVDRGVTTTSASFGRTEENFYAPIVARGQAAPAGGFRYFVRRSAVRSGSQPRLRQLFMGAETGVLVAGGLSAEVKALLARSGVAVAEPHWLLTAPSARTETADTVAGLATMIGMLLLLGGGAALLGTRRRGRG